MRPRIGLFFSLSFAAGVLITQLLSELPSMPSVGLLLVLGVLLFKRLSLLSAFLFAVVYTSLHGNLALRDNLPKEWEMKDVVVNGYIVSLPDNNSDRSKFNFHVKTLFSEQGELDFSGKIRLSWYGKSRPDLSAGEQWTLKVRLKRPWGTLNPGVFDYQGWLWQQGIRATGYVRFSSENRLLSEEPVCCLIDRLRQQIRYSWSQKLPTESAAILTALAIGDRSQFTDAQWDHFRATGTNHLVAISGLHVGLIAGILYFLVLRLWRSIPSLSLIMASPRAAAIAAIIAAVLYSALAGFSIPTQRASIMVIAFLLPLIFGRQLRPLNGLALALLVVLVIDPRSVLSTGFVLSFTAVAAILWGLSCQSGKESYLVRLFRLQWVILLIMMPLSLMLFNQTSLLAFPVNLIAIPWFSFVLVPIALVGAIVTMISPALGSRLVELAAPLFHWTLEALKSLSDIGIGQLEAESRPVWIVVIACIGLAWLVAPIRLQGRHLGIIALLPVFFHQPKPMKYGDFEVIMLDVGQGLAMVIKTRDHMLLYDTGPSYKSGFNAGSAIVVPFLRSKGWKEVDTLVISHPARDHIGGLTPVLNQLAVREILGREKPCRDGIKWHWDGVDFEVLHPIEGVSWEANDSSCVLMISNGGGSLLLTADLEKPGEESLITRYGNQLKSSVVQVGHHGSRTSSTSGFVAAVSPQYALVANGYRNRYGFPIPEVMDRWRQAGAEIHETAKHGALSITVDAVTGPGKVRQERVIQSRFWR